MRAASKDEDAAHRMHPGDAQDAAERVHVTGVVVVAGDQHDLDAVADQALQGVVEQLFGLGRRRERVESVPGNEYEVDLLLSSRCRRPRRAPPRTLTAVNGRGSGGPGASRQYGGVA
jgi:hypothetical protein